MFSLSTPEETIERPFVVGRYIPVVRSLENVSEG
ncbi:MAG: hypothetical protein ACD_82C00098G0001 [uncultured bacterium]|nr:MAG: hypothetical protein ACD_82C00098G0001 [uncultured bacterium]